MNLHPVSTAAVAVFFAGVLAACGQTTQSQAPPATQIWHEIVQCLRAHGDPTLPDPTVDSQGRATFPPGTQPPSQATIQACQSIINRLPAAVRPNTPDIQMEIRFAQCMRGHGLPDWPDPNADGSFTLPPDLHTTYKSGPVWDRIKAGADACKAFDPNGSFEFGNA